MQWGFCPCRKACMQHRTQTGTALKNEEQIYQKNFGNGRCDIIMKGVVFDLGGTLMQYVGMPYSWEDFYYKGFEEIKRI